MEDKLTTGMEASLIKLVNETLFDEGMEIEEYQKVEFYVYSENIIKDILHACKFKDIGNVYDFPNDLPQPESIDGFDLSANYDMFQRIALSKKLNSICFYSIERYCIKCTFLIDTDYLKKFSKKTKDILRQDSQANMFRNVDFKCSEREFIEVSDATGDNMKPADVIKKKVAKEKLVFDEDSAIVQVMNNIMNFFKPETQHVYERMQVPYKRGIILHGDPGNGKSAAIREIIRTVPKIAKIVINPNVSNVTRVLSSLVKSLDGKQAIVIIEDIDSLITDRNRSDFLNILDGVDVKSGVYFIGTTNYPNQIDPAFMNRPGRFDQTYMIGNPSEISRRRFFESRDVGELLSEYKVFKDENIPDSNEAVVDLFVKHSENMSMAGLKEIMTGTQYLLASSEDLTIEEALEKTASVIINNRAEHAEQHENYKSNSRESREARYRQVSL